MLERPRTLAREWARAFPTCSRSIPTLFPPVYEIASDVVQYMKPRKKPEENDDE